MSPGTPDLIFLIYMFVGLQALWIIPIIKNNNKINERGKELREEIKQLEKIYKKQRSDVVFIFLYNKYDI